MKFDHSKPHLGEALGIASERARDIKKRLLDLSREYSKWSEAIEKVLEEFTNEEERIYALFKLGELRGMEVSLLMVLEG